MQLLQTPFAEDLTNTFRQILLTRQRDGFALQSKIERAGGLDHVARHDAITLVQSLYHVTFDEGAPFGVSPYISSFCSHSGPNDEYEKDHGLLSQWRGYGGSGGFCIVFDTARLANFLGQELDGSFHIYLRIDPVRYAFKGKNVIDLLPEIVSRCGHFYEKYILEDRDDLDVADAFIPFVRGAAFLKHQAFHEEHEVRIVALPGMQALSDLTAKEHPEFTVKPLKVTGKTDGGKRFISLFDNTKSELPIQRIIVGPSQQQQANFEFATQLAAARFPITRSDTPVIIQGP
jgi:Protein of unknown function (DUF2971)